MTFEYKEIKGQYKVFMKEKSRAQQHSFNYPYQMVRLPDKKVYDDLTNNGYGKISKELARLVDSNAIMSNQGKDADSYTITLKPNKIIVFGTDGLFDNMFIYEITNIIQEYIKNKNFKCSTVHAQQLSRKL